MKAVHSSLDPRSWLKFGVANAGLGVFVLKYFANDFPQSIVKSHKKNLQFTGRGGSVAGTQSRPSELKILYQQAASARL